jgi:hypothetical protein
MEKGILPVPEVENIFGGDSPVFEIPIGNSLDAMDAMDAMMMGEDPLSAMMNDDPIQEMLNDLTGGGGITVRPMMGMDVETIEIEDSVLPDGNHVHKEKHMKNGVESVNIRSDRPMSQETIMDLM